MNDLYSVISLEELAEAKARYRRLGRYLNATAPADRTHSPRHRAGSRRNRRLGNVPTFASDRRPS